MRILFLSNIFPSPLNTTKGVFNRGLVQALMCLGHDVAVVTPISWIDWVRASRSRRKETKQTTEVSSGASVRYPVYVYTPGILRSAYGTFMWQSIRGAVLDAIARQRTQVIISYWAHPDGECAVRAARQAGVPAVVMVGGSDVLLLTSNRSRRRAVYRVLEAADAVVAVSRDLQQTIVLGGINRQKVHVVRRGIDTDRFRPGEQQNARRRLDLPSEPPLLLWVGRMESVKGLPILVEAIHQLHLCGDPCHTVLVGTGSQAQRIFADVERRGLAAHVTMRGTVPHAALADYYRAANAVVLPSFSEGIPNVLLESIACGTPFVASKVGGIPEIATPGIDRLVPPGDPTSLAKAIREILAVRRTTKRRTFVPENWPAAASYLVSVVEPLIKEATIKPKENTVTCPPATI